MNWSDLLVHPFWQGALQHLAQESETSTDVRESLRQSAANFTSTMMNDNRPTTAVTETAHTGVADHTDATRGHATDETRPGESVISLAVTYVAW